eukprot:Mycagemm_TRINITY_DN10058_c0_g5::TRINITY_DN10058_c0_g5_i1::g.2231::m.2231 type:complete len:100 gc:universal TRINITY_DN10058_c0_g5_i1:490-191(-)
MTKSFVKGVPGACAESFTVAVLGVSPNSMFTGCEGDVITLMAEVMLKFTCTCRPYGISAVKSFPTGLVNIAVAPSPLGAYECVGSTYVSFPSSKSISVT